MSDTLMRHWQMLRLVPRQPRKIDTATLEERLNERGYFIDRRSIQRDLIKLSQHFQLISDERSKPFGWSWAKDAKPFDIPGMDTHTALAFALAGKHLAHLLPKATFDHLDPHITYAQQRLESDAGQMLGKWRDCVRVLPGGQPMAPPNIDAEILQTVQDGLLHRRQLHMNYTKRGAERQSTYVVHPLSLVYRDSVAYLLCTLFDYSDVVQLAVHRINAIAELPDESRRPDDFDVDAYIASGQFGFQISPELLPLQARLHPKAAVRLYETPLSDDQQLEVLPDGWVLVRASLADTALLRVWLRGHGDLCEVISPPSLRAEIAGQLAAAAARYAKPPAS